MCWTYLVFVHHLVTPPLKPHPIPLKPIAVDPPQNVNQPPLEPPKDPILPGEPKQDLQPHPKCVELKPAGFYRALHEGCVTAATVTAITGKYKSDDNSGYSEVNGTYLSAQTADTRTIATPKYNTHHSDSQI
ncbi:hypothetical protein SERLA73DRAFT_68663 [Serpula lacrymans var. lacrymans S7.3]|uniref:Uncharacterized protein n=1 Tax=Serpula lacrymans var. lacrymans (strain S7.3) TaxID=936435 RepID=F8PHL9_SERL3|nr:hypothetical protein SERLA73DRAFT_68663 [Serpula lacrymans var. lacrymans S7.3]